MFANQSRNKMFVPAHHNQPLPCLSPQDATTLPPKKKPPKHFTLLLVVLMQYVSETTLTQTSFSLTRHIHGGFFSNLQLKIKANFEHVNICGCHCNVSQRWTLMSSVMVTLMRAGLYPVFKTCITTTAAKRPDSAQVNICPCLIQSMFLKTRSTLVFIQLHKFFFSCSLTITVFS